MPPLKAQLLLEESLSAYFPEMVFTDSGITVQLHRNTHQRGWMFENGRFAPKRGTNRTLLDPVVKQPQKRCKPSGSKCPVLAVLSCEIGY